MNTAPPTLRAAGAIEVRPGGNRSLLRLLASGDWYALPVAAGTTLLIDIAIWQLLAAVASAWQAAAGAARDAAWAVAEAASASRGASSGAGPGERGPAASAAAATASAAWAVARAAAASAASAAAGDAAAWYELAPGAVIDALIAIRDEEQEEQE